MARKGSIIKGEGITQAPMYWLDDPDLIEVEENFNARTDLKIDDQFINSIKEQGVLVPLVCVRNEGDNGEQPFLLRDGECRLEAVKRLASQGIKLKIPVHVIGKADEMKNKAKMAIINMHRQDFSPVDEADLCAQFDNWGWKYKQIGDAFGRSHEWARQRLTLSGASPKVKQALRDELIDATEALEIVKAKKFAAQDAKLQEALGDELAEELDKTVEQKAAETPATKKATAKKAKKAKKARKKKASSKKIKVPSRAFLKRFIKMLQENLPADADEEQTGTVELVAQSLKFATGLVSEEDFIKFVESYMSYDEDGEGEETEEGEEDETEESEEGDEGEEYEEEEGEDGEDDDVEVEDGGEEEEEGEED